jgi:predicted acyl esterase
MVASEVLRGRYRNGFEKPAPIEPNKIIKYIVDLRSNDHCFIKGHKIMVQVQSTWFPLIDRNPQKYIDNIFKARESDFQSVTQKIYRTKSFPSNVTVPVLKDQNNY